MPSGGSRCHEQGVDLMMQSEGVLRPPAIAAQTTGALAAWDFQWVDAGAPEQLAHVTGQLRWRGFELGFAVDGLLGVDGRLAGPGLAAMPPDLQQLVLKHFADECLLSFKGTPLADMSLLSLQWHEDPLPMEGEFEFTVRRAELQRSSRGRLTVFEQAGRLQLINALASLQWPMPLALSTVSGRLHIGSASLMPEECADLEVGDLVWLDDAELAPSGLRAQFIPAHESGAPCWVWIKRSSVLRQAASAAVASWPNQASRAPAAFFTVTSPEVTVQRSWFQGAITEQRLAQTALALPWQLCAEAGVRFEGQLLVVGRRLGLRVTTVL
jgi:hypothetical protein